MVTLGEDATVIKGNLREEGAPQPLYRLRIGWKEAG
jgi:hypothetical protein